MRCSIPLVPLLLLVVSVVASASLALAPVVGQPVAAVFPPWWTAARSFAAAAAANVPIIQAGAVASIVIAIAETQDSARNLRRAGAMLVLDARALGGCQPRPPTQPISPEGRS